LKSVTAIADGYLRKAERALHGARLLLSREATEGACSRDYYAMHDAAHEALLATGFETPDAIIKTHHSLIAEFGKKLVLSGRIEPQLGRAFNDAQEMRLLADYSAEPPSSDDSRRTVQQAEEFVAAVSNMISGLHS
jgi:uncharacterized protein (UPF0332 family)